MKKFLIAVALLLTSAAQAADFPIKAPVASGYPTTRCGLYYGVGTGGNAGHVNGATVGTEIVQGNLDVLGGYTCPFANDAFWFVEAEFGFSNLNGSSEGLALSGPLTFQQRVAFGSPINNLLNIFPSANFPSLPSIPLLPAGISQGPANGYLFAGIVEQDIRAQIGLASGHQWVVAPMLGVGILTRLSNNVVVDTYAGWQMNSNSFCPGGGGACARLGNMARVGVSLKY